MTIVSRELLCGITYMDVVACAGMNQGQAAKRLGVSTVHLRRVLHRIGAQHWLDGGRQRHRPLCLSADDVAQLAAEGYTQKDAAFIAGVSYNYFKVLVGRYELNHIFPGNGHAQFISKKGYCS